MKNERDEVRLYAFRGSLRKKCLKLGARGEARLQWRDVLNEEREMRLGVTKEVF